MILLKSFNPLSYKHGVKFERASRAQSPQNMRARQQNREPRARGLALKKSLCMCECECVCEWGTWGVDEGWMLLPTRLQQL